VDAASPHALLQLRGAMLPRTLADGRTHGAVKAPLQCAAAAALLPTMAAAAAITAALASLPAGVRAAAAPALHRLAHGLSLSGGSSSESASAAAASGPFGGAAAVSPLEVAAALSAAFGGAAAASAAPSTGSKGPAGPGVAGGRAVLLPLTLGGVHVDASNFNLPLYKNLLSTSRSGLLVSFEPALALLHSLRARYGHGASLSLLLGSAGLSVRQGVEAAVQAAGLSSLLASGGSAETDGAGADAAPRWCPAALEGSLRCLSITGAGALALAPSAAIAVSWRHGALAASEGEAADAGSGGKVASASLSSSASAAAATGFELVPGLSGTSAAGEGLRRMWRQQRAAAVLAEMSAAGAGLVKSAALLGDSA
jgi:hypothetical protein